MVTFLDPFKLDPGPCPVDDAPHHTCTSPDYRGTITAGVIRPATSVVVQVGGVLTTAPAPLAAPAPVQAEETFTTATYQRRRHGREARRTRR